LRRHLLAAALLMPATRGASAAGPPLIAAAANLQFALTEVVQGFRVATGQEVRVTLGSSGNLVRQIEQGAPVELFFSADEDFVFRLRAGGHARDDGTLYAVGRIALFTPPGSPIETAAGLDGLRAALDAGQVRRFAIANPEHAPYGRAARQALEAAGLWDRLRPYLAFGENVSQAAQFALAGGSQGGIVAWSLVLSPTLAGRGAAQLLPEALHAPLRQRMVLTRRAGPVAEALYAFLQQPPAREVMRRYGFVLPGE